jgi:hypothetical protein
MIKLTKSIEDLLPVDVLPLLNEVLTTTEADLQIKLVDFLTSLGYEPTFVNQGSESYIYAVGKEPWLLVAHTDTVLPTPPQLFVQNELFGDNLFLLSGKGGLGADDRAGVAAMIIYLAAGLRPSIFLPSGEERGGLGSKAFIKNDMNVFADKINFMIQFDRQSTKDAVQYTDTNQSLMNIFIERHFVTAIGSYTDISDLMPALGVSGLNLSIGYDKQHTASETLDVISFLICIQAAYKTLTTMNVDVKHIYVKRVLDLATKTPYETVSLFDEAYKYDSKYSDSYTSSWNSYKPTTSTKSYVSTSSICDLCLTDTKDVFTTSEGDICRTCFHEPSNKIKDYIIGFCPDCDLHIKPSMVAYGDMPSGLSLAYYPSIQSFSLACPDCQGMLLDVDYNAKVTDTLTLEEFLKLQGVNL